MENVFGQGVFRLHPHDLGGDGILPHHIPLLAQLVDEAMVRIAREGEDDLPIAVDRGFMSVNDKGLIILAESAEFGSELHADAARRDTDSNVPRTAAKGRARLRALGLLD
jgi:F-type H+-transporting ATPase subunit epsilon